MKLMHALALVAPLTLVPATPSFSSDQNDAEAFVAQVRQDAAFLQKSSEAALRASASEKVVAFAKQEAAAQAVALATLPAGSGVQLEQGTPLTVAANIDHATPSADGTILTGRSAAIDTSVGASEPSDQVASDTPLAAPGVIVMPELAQAKGEAFDSLYKASQAAALKSLIKLYGAYSTDGKVPELRAMALRGLFNASQQLQQVQQL